MAQEKVWIFGCGDLGARLAAQLPKREFSVYGVRRNPLVALARRRRAGALQWRRGDATNKEAVAELLADGADVILATFTPKDRSPNGYQHAYVDTATTLAEVLPKLPRPPRLLIWVSSTRVYGQNSDQLIDESTPASPANFQGDKLLAAEEIIRRAAPTVCVVRFAGIYGPGRDRMLSQVRAGRCAPAEPTQFTNRIHVDDCVGFLTHLITQQRLGWSPEQLYIGSDCTPVPLHELQQWLAKAMGYTSAHLREFVQSCGRQSKKLNNRLMLASGYQMKFPDFRAGYSALLDSEN
ncbi:sugar nucleotide-binding protein [Microbulbifer sp. TYP-18]|uniref:sugar nucleotide-binding protein n=1 Tax=Microbulbifer sp. TYP-18 TaxID=3230024 RepID=UPI0034C643A1